MVWVREGRGELATGVCSAYSLNASDRPRLKNDMALKQWKSRAAGTMCCFNCRSGGEGGGRGGPLRAEHSSFCIDRWMLPLAIHLALVKHSQRQIGGAGGASAPDLEPASNVFQSCLLFSSSSCPPVFLCYYTFALQGEYMWSCTFKNITWKMYLLFCPRQSLKVAFY